MARPKAGVRSKTSHRTPEQIEAHGDTYQASKERKKYRSELGTARTAMEKKVGKKAMKGKDMAHKTPRGRDFFLQARGKNRGHGTSPGGTKKGTRRA